jgi:phosphoenolpyruvate carboxylase
VQRTVQLRNPAVLPLNMLQVALMELWQAQPSEEAGPQSPWHETILLSITGIAAGMQSTG